MEYLNICGIVKESIVDGKGIRYVVFAQGCPHACKGCHNPQSHPFEGGKKITLSEILTELQKNPLLDGVTFSGGEPFCQAEAFSKLAKEIKKLKLDIWTYTGYTFEELLKLSDTDTHINSLLHLTDVLADGRFIEKQKSLLIKFRGSKNQRLIDIRKTFESGKISEINI